MIPALASAVARGKLRPTRVTRAELAQRLTLTLTLRRSDQAGFERFLAAATNPRSPEYRHYLSQPQLAERFGPSRRAYDELERWLKDQRLTVLSGSANRLTLTVSGTVAQVRRSFGVTIRRYQLGGRSVYANASAPAVPGYLAGKIQAISGLSNLAQPSAGPAGQSFVGAHGPGKVQVNCTNGNCTITITINGKSYTFNVNLPSAQFCVGFLVSTGIALARTGAAVAIPWALGLGLINCLAIESGVYNYVNVNFTIGHTSALPKAAAAGDPQQKIGLLEFDTFHQSDVANWLSMLQLDPSQLSRLSEVPVDGGLASPGPGEGEVLLDIDASLLLTLRSQANVVVYDAPASANFASVFNAMINDGDTVISNSWAQCEDETPLADAQAIDSVLAQAAASGVSVLNGTGDSGSTCLDGAQNTAAVPADSPNATAVGGSTYVPGLNSTYGVEGWWDGTSDTPASGQGGFGVSSYFARPAYQNGLTSASGRSIPDVVGVADPLEGMQICQADGGGCPDGLDNGGTSLAAPEWASIIADLNTQLGHDIGNVNAALYPLGDTPAFQNASAMGSDFAHVGLGDANYLQLLGELGNYVPGPVSGSGSEVIAVGTNSQQDAVPADGATQGEVRVVLLDADGFPVKGQSVTLTAPGCPSATIASASGQSDDSGAVGFTVTDTTSETCTFTAKDTSDDTTLTAQPTLSFVPPVATGAQISANPATVNDDGMAMVTINVYLENALGQPASGKTVSLSSSSTNATITPNSMQAATGSNGVATFTATDSTQETVSFTATDVTDGNLPVPGSATVNFQPTSSTPCADAAPTPIMGYSVSQWGTGLTFNSSSLTGEDGGSFTFGACSSADIAFDSAGHAYLGDWVNGAIYDLGTGGGAAGSSNALPDTSFAPGGSSANGPQLGGIAFGKNGELYAGVAATNGESSAPELVQLDPSSGALERTIVTSADGLLPCPYYIAVDPLSGDVFATDECTGFDASNELTRISNPGSSSPTVSNYADLGTLGDGLAFAPDGTIYVAANGNDTIESVGATNTTPTVATVATLSAAPVDVAIASVDGSGHATALYALDTAGNVYRIDLTQTPAVVTTIASGGGVFQSAAAGPDGCLYAVDLDNVLKVGGACSGTPAPAIDLTPTSDLSAPPTGSGVTFTATFSNVSPPSGTPIELVITGANPQVKLVDSDASGSAAFSYSGVFAGTDTVVATANVNGNQITSAPIAFRWVAGKDTSSLSLNGSQESGLSGQSVKLLANLTDVTTEPVSPIAGAPVMISLGGQSCTATTDSSGNASCSITPSGAQGLEAVSASYAGDSTHTPSTATNVFELGGVGLAPPAPGPGPGPGLGVGSVPANTGLPAVTGTPKAGNTLTCSPGTWTGSPTAYAYQWNRYGTPLAGVTRNTYRLGTLDEGSTLTCRVIASNAFGQGAPATSKAVSVVLPHVAGCPRATGRVSGVKLGLVSLGMTRKQARHAYTHSSTRGKRYEDFFCLTPIGVRVGYASPKLLRLLPPGQRKRLAGRVVWISTSNPYFAIKGIRQGSALAATEAKIHGGNLFHVGLNFWYLAPAGTVTAVFKVRAGVVEEIGIAEKGLTRTKKSRLSFITSFS